MRAKQWTMPPEQAAVAERPPRTGGNSSSGNNNNSSNSNNNNSNTTSIFAIPPPLKRLFDRFPLSTYPPNELPARSPQLRTQNALYVFVSEQGAAAGEASFNPGCLKWQAYLKFCNVDFHLVSSSNHASPSGVLPFLLPAVPPSTSSPSLGSAADQVRPVPSNKLQKWVVDHIKSVVEEPADMRYEAYMALLDHPIRRAWLLSLYLTSNANSVAEPLYVASSSGNPLVRTSIAHSLRLAAEKELLKHSAIIEPQRLLREGEEALDALNTALGNHQWFFGARRPGLLDAAVFAYTNLLLEDELGGGQGWSDRRLCDAMKKRRRLVEHRERIVESYF